MCGETMRLEERVRVLTIPGAQQTVEKKLTEWICPECDYFEDVDEDD